MEYHIQCNAEDIAPLVLLTRDPESATRISAMIEGAKLVSMSRGYYVYTGTVTGTRVSVASTGVGGPQLAIGIEELAHMGAHTFIKITPGWPLSTHLHPGELILPLGVYRGGATAQHYLPIPFPAIPDFKLARAVQEIASKQGIQIRRGVGISLDAIFPPMPEFLKRDCQVVQALTVDMDSDTFFVMSSNYGWRSVAIQVVYKQEGLGSTSFEQGEAKAVAIARGVIHQIDAEGTANPVQTQKR
jgi:uridine phosphorylase